ncbi:hypothetical protein [Salininema proteolyticum]|uniref:DUF91 domain-containing protein n=1 Tax=Salininema proteolyticum TaxID=1607685 RepID=A0ABV8U403_9ACTN
MSRERLAFIDATSMRTARRCPLSELGIHERRDLQRWLIENPTLLPEDLLIVTEEFADWEAADGTRVRDRLDLLALDKDGYPVVIELKRGDAPAHTHLQALDYAAMVSRLTESDFADLYAKFHGTEARPVSQDEAFDAIDSYLDISELDAELLRQPRVMVVASDFPPQLTSGVVWLNTMGIDCTLIQVSAWVSMDGAGPDSAPQKAITFSKLYPTVEEETLVVEPARRAREASERKVQNSRSRKVVTRLYENSIIPEGTRFKLDPVRPGWRERARDWMEENPDQITATWVRHQSKPLKWDADGQLYSPTGLGKKLLKLAFGDDEEMESLAGPQYWFNDDDKPLNEIADETDLPDDRRS